MIHPYSGILLSCKEIIGLIRVYNIDEYWKHDAKWKKLITEDHLISGDSIYMKCPE